MTNPLKWKYESQVGLLVSTIAGAGFGILIGYRSEMDCSAHLFGRLSALSFSAERFILIGPFVSAHVLPSSLPRTLVRRTNAQLFHCA